MFITQALNWEKYIISDNVNDILIPVYDYQFMALQLYTLCTNFSKRKQLVQEGRKIVEANFNLSKDLNVLARVYKSCIAILL